MMPSQFRASAGPVVVALNRAIVVCVLLAGATPSVSFQQKNLSKETFEIAPNFRELEPRAVAVVPMINMTLDPEASAILHNAVYERLQAKGYQKIDAARVGEVMKRLGIQTPEMLSGISYQRLGRELKCDAVIQGEVNQYGTQNQGVYSSVQVSCSLRMVHTATGKVLWYCEQFRAAHRQWQFDPFNFLINAAEHASASKPDRIAWLVQEMFRTLPTGPIQVVRGDLLSRAVEIRAATAPQDLTVGAGANAEPDQADASFTILFEADRSDISPDAEDTLRQVVPFIDAFSDAEVALSGYSDSIETQGEALSLKRAETCRDWIVQRLKRQNQVVKVEGFGSATAAASDATPADRQQNRSVRITVRRIR